MVTDEKIEAAKKKWESACKMVRNSRFMPNCITAGQVRLFEMEADAAFQEYRMLVQQKTVHGDAEESDRQERCSKLT